MHNGAEFVDRILLLHHGTNTKLSRGCPQIV
jgi:hypothetical protein